MRKNLLKSSVYLFIILTFAACKNEKEDPKTNPESTYTAILNGANEVPANSSTATGSASATYNSSTKILTAAVTYSAMTVTAGHIHKGEIGVAGPVVFPFSTTDSPIYFTSTALTIEQEADLMANRLYVNLHSAAYPGGEIRGQLIKQ